MACKRWASGAQPTLRIPDAGSSWLPQLTAKAARSAARDAQCPHCRAHHRGSEERARAPSPARDRHITQFLESQASNCASPALGTQSWELQRLHAKEMLSMKRFKSRPLPDLASAPTSTEKTERKMQFLELYVHACTSPFRLQRPPGFKNSWQGLASRT